MKTKRSFGCVIFTAFALAATPRVSPADVTVTAVIQRPGMPNTEPDDPNQRIIADSLMKDMPSMAVYNGKAVPLKIFAQGALERLESWNECRMWDRARGTQITLTPRSHNYILSKIPKITTYEQWLHAWIVDTHQWKRIAGRRAHHYKISRGSSNDKSQADVWVVPGLDAPAVLFPQMVTMESPGLEAVITRLKGLCVRLDLKFSPDLSTSPLTYRVQTISTRALSPSVFAAPKGYQPYIEAPLPPSQPMPSIKPLVTTDLTSAAAHGQLEAVSEFLTIGYDINERDRMGDTPLIAALKPQSDSGQTPTEFHEPVAMARFLLDHKAHVNLPNSQDGATPLIDAAVGGYVKITALLLSRGADIHAVDKTGRTALDWATLLHRNEIIRLLEAAPKN